jgi:hypothetical protein
MGKTRFHTKGEKKINAREAVKPFEEYVNVPLASLAG